MGDDTHMYSPRTSGGSGLLERKISLTKTIEKRKDRDKEREIDGLRKKLSTDEDVMEVHGQQQQMMMGKTMVRPKHPTGKKMRDKVREVLAKALASDGEGVISTKENTLTVACCIEEAMWTTYKETNNDYKAKFRMLHFNLKDKKNGNLRKEVLSNRINANQLIKMTSEELANDDLKKYREQVKQHMMYEAQPEKGIRQATTDMWRCLKCNNRKCTFYQMQTRAADEPMTTFITCTVCGNRWTQSG